MRVLRSVLLGFTLLCAVWVGAVQAAEPLAPADIPQNLDPHLAVTLSEQALSRALFMGLVQHDARGDLAPGVAERWAISLNGMEYRFHLRPDAAWSDGRRITAQSVVASLERALDPDTGAPFYALLLPIKNAEAFRLGTLAPDQKLGISAPDAQTVLITLDHPSHRLLDALAAPLGAVVPLHRIKAAPSQWSRPGNIIGNGAFLLMKNQNAYVLKRKDGAGPDLAIAAENAALTLDVFPSSQNTRPALYQMLVNVAHAPLDQRDVRHALSMTIDREALVAALEVPTATAAYSLLPQGEALQAPYARLSPADRKIVAEALLLDVPRDKPIRVVFPDQPVHHRVGAAVLVAWTALGFQVQLQPVPAAHFERTILNGAFDVAWMPPWTLGAHRADQLFPFSQAAGPWNAGGYREPAFDQYLVRADADQSADGRKIQWRGAEDVLVEDQPVWPLFFYSTSQPQIFDAMGWAMQTPQ